VIDDAPGKAEGRTGVLDVHGRPDNAAGGVVGAKAVVLGSQGAA
jgi:hypothetical protein